MATVPIPQGANVGAPDRLALKQQMNGLVPIPQGAQVGEQPDSFLGGVGRRIKSMAQAEENKSLLDRVLETTGPGPLIKVARGLWQSDRQLAPQLVDQVKQAAASHRGDTPLQTASPFNVNLEDARAVTTGLSMLDPFASGSVGNVNQLQGEGRGAEAAGQGLTDAALLAAGLAAPRIGQVGQTAKILARPPLRMAAEAAKDIPVVRGVLKGGAALKDVPGQLRQVWNPPTPEASPAQAFSPQPLAVTHDVPSLQVRPTQGAPANLLDSPASGAGASRGTQGEFPVIPPEAAPTQAFSPQPLSAKPAPAQWTPEMRRTLLEDMGHSEGVDPYLDAPEEEQDLAPQLQESIRLAQRMRGAQQ